MIDGIWVAALTVKLLFVLVIILTFSPVLVWVDRRQSAMIQDRLGPNRAGIPIGGKNITLFGLLHPLADALKFMWKEDFIPPRADKLLFALAPIISVIPTIAAFAVIPFGDVIYLDHLFEVLPANPDGRAFPFQVASLNVGILYVFAVAGTGVVGAAIAGYCSDNKYALLGGLRAAGQMVSYEVTLGLSLVGCFMLYNSLLLEDAVAWQGEHGFGGWGIFRQPIAFILFYVGSIAETKRIPFDIPEGESELAAGYFTEYSGMKFGMFMMGEYIATVVSCALIVALFFGGWHLPFLERDGIHFFNTYIAMPHWAVSLIYILSFIGKLVVMLWLTMMIRWSLPRFRYDQVMKMCWRYMLPLSLFNIFITGMFILLFADK
ncbi:MAG TPA: NADH-quinone oxidoreductase subunit NuoH [Polyangiales bacterium]|nr:NADH-quinone oxidoreductase subunit NuoH [Polyangiales bacterium]